MTITPIKHLTYIAVSTADPPPPVPDMTITSIKHLTYIAVPTADPPPTVSDMTTVLTKCRDVQQADCFIFGVLSNASG
jgi:hypothetical protein